MGNPFEGQTFMLMWIGFLALMTCCIALFFYWGIRTGQFSDQDRARYLPLNSGIPPADEPKGEGKPEQEGRRPLP